MAGWYERVRSLHFALMAGVFVFAMGGLAGLGVTAAFGVEGGGATGAATIAGGWAALMAVAYLRRRTRGAGDRLFRGLALLAVPVGVGCLVLAANSEEPTADERRAARLRAAGVDPLAVQNAVDAVRGVPLADPWARKPVPEGDAPFSLRAMGERARAAEAERAAEASETTGQPAAPDAGR